MGEHQRRLRIWRQIMAEKNRPAPVAGARMTPEQKKRRVPEGKRRFFDHEIVEEEVFVLGRPGSDLLSQGLSHSTIGAEEFNGRVRDGIGFKLLARTTRPAKDKDTKQARSRKRSSAVPGLDPGTSIRKREGLCFDGLPGSPSAKTP